jgi:hypothetical protein
MFCRSVNISTRTSIKTPGSIVLTASETKYLAKGLELGAQQRMTSCMSLAMLVMAQFAGNGDNAIRHGMLGIFSREEQGGLRQKSSIVELYDELRPSLYGYLICLGLTPYEADDIIQEAFLSLFHHLEGNGKTDNLRGWIFRVAHNLSRNLQRRERRLVSDSDIEGELLASERADASLNPEDSYLWKEPLVISMYKA